MKASDAFKKTIEAELQAMASKDLLFAEKLANPNKKIDECITYILNWVQKQDCNGFTEDEIFGQAAHYYDEENIEIGNPIQCRVVVNHKVELTAEDIQAAKQSAIDKVIEDERARMTKKTAPKKVEPTATVQSSLFD